MCILNYRPYDDEGPDVPPQRAQPRLTWAIPVDMSKLGARLQAYSETMPQVTMLRLCHRFGNVALSNLPLELLERIVEALQQSVRADTWPAWRQDLRCFEGICLPEQHCEYYNEHVESMWQEIFAASSDEDAKSKEDYTNAQKVDMVTDSIAYDPESELVMKAHYDARFRWVGRTCQCVEGYGEDATRGAFARFGDLLRLHFGLEAIILHEILPTPLFDFLPNSGFSEEFAYYTRCYLTLYSKSGDKRITGSPDSAPQNKLFHEYGDHMSFQETIDPSQLILSENDRLRFAKAMRLLGIRTCYHLSELAPHVVHPIEDEWLSDLCACGKSESICPHSDVKSYDKPYCLEEYLKSKSKELAKQTWPKLMLLAASDVVNTFEY
ncbi:hypothetical protein P153DRAFT_395197 [Dothidotthia symphoricarpi CBS 119687]|uniref:Uncharacterized protein n=1 Tax=Dothidotthia symphoricarpi CBS 119687 TaxID=1392245 RepID=A0A6A6AFT8_9PLEO|nr:uncharacterized protein P153DRAFT_395197 [Dothidotthia symphoricarpi CBS 119687]KAF2130769.1 hypothetical protein P153DRAFT_395197 [Dothidotthia symphoricarpi CBS 119687]